MFDDPHYQSLPAQTAAVEFADRLLLHGDPTQLVTAAAVLRVGNAEQIFGARFPGEYVMISIAPAARSRGRQNSRAR
jgi:hypothetical protein